jgi:hypothetical protein
MELGLMKGGVWCFGIRGSFVQHLVTAGGWFRRVGDYPLALIGFVILRVVTWHFWVDRLAHMRRWAVWVHPVEQSGTLGKHDRESG